MGVAAVTRARDRLLAADTAELRVAPLCEEIIRAFHDVAHFDRCALLTTDPETLLPSGGVIEGFESEDCTHAWDNELLDPDFNKYSQLARSHDPVATLVDAVDGDLDRSPRYQKMYSRIGAADELRVAFVAGTSCLAIGVFIRPSDAGAFTAEELSDVRQLVPVATTALRRALGRLSEEATSRSPVVIILNADGEIAAVSAGGQRILEAMRTPVDDEGGLPSVVQAAATKERRSRTATSLTTRVRDGSGQWLCLHVTPIEGEAGAVAVLVDKARTGDLVPILLDAYGLTAREKDVALPLARGHSFKQIATELIISVHTVRDHVKAIYDKAGVRSRGELVATLFADQILVHPDATRLPATPASPA